MYRVDLNSDLGESFGNYKIGMDDQVIPLITSANVACGYHASDPLVMDKTIKMAKEAPTQNLKTLRQLQTQATLATSPSTPTVTVT